VQRYLSGKSLKESRLGLLFNGVIKVPMQFLVLFVGILVFVFFQFVEPPIHYNTANLSKLENTQYQAQLSQLEQEHDLIFDQKQTAIRHLITAIRQEDQPAIEATRSNVTALHDEDKAIRKQVKELILKQDPDADIEDADYVFITFITKHLPIGLIGLLLADIFSAAMSSTSSELSALATTTVVDIYRRSFVKNKSDRHYLNASKWFTILWGGVALTFAAFASLFDNLIEAVNIVGSIFYGTILGIFLVAFFFKKIGGKAVFTGAFLAEGFVITFFILDKYQVLAIAYLWLNLIGCALVIALSWLLQQVFRKGSGKR